MTIVRNTFDKRINNIKDIQCVTNGYDTSKYLGKKGYFANTIHAFECLETGTYYGKYVSHLNSDHCFLTDFNNVVGGNPSCKSFRYFLPEELLKPIEKKYRPFTNEEFKVTFKIGKVIQFKRKSDAKAFKLMLLGYIPFLNYQGSWILLGDIRFSTDILFKDYELYDPATDKYVPFGIKE